MTDPTSGALDQLQAYGLQVANLVVDGVLHRCKVEGDKGSKKSGWYVAHLFRLDNGQEVVTGRFGNWKIDSEPQAFQFDVEFTDADRAQYREKMEQTRKAAQREKRERNKQAAQRAAKIWPDLPTEGKSEYLARKKIYGYGCRYTRGSIVVPMVNSTENLVGLQFIAGDGDKKFLSGTAKQGAYHVISRDDRDGHRLGGRDPIVFCEGYATGCSIRMATGYTVVVCFDADNLHRVVLAWRQMPEVSDHQFIVAADNDHLGEKNKGLETAARLVDVDPQVRVVWPFFEDGEDGTDFNDLHVSEGPGAIREDFSREPQALPVESVSDQSAYTPPEPAAEVPSNRQWYFDLKTTNSGAIKPVRSNIFAILNNDPQWKDTLTYCDFSYRIIKKVAPMPDMREGEWEDADTSRLAIFLSDQYNIDPGRQNINDAVVVAAQRARFHPVIDYLESLTWDEVPRIDQWLYDVYDSTQAAEYLSVVGSKFLIAAVARVFDPGCKFDNVMILEGAQGLKKSTSLSVMFGDWFSDAPVPIGEKDAYQNIQGVWCCELAELDSFNKAESTSAKQFFSQKRDRYRPSYGAYAQDYPRQTIFVGTTNQNEYLKDYTGNRRYWPVQCFKADTDYIRENRDQLFAEALVRYRAGETWWVDDAARSVFEAEQEMRLQIDPWQLRIEDFLEKSTADFHTSDDILTEAIKRDMAAVTRADQNRISPIMKKLGWVNTKKRIQIGAKKVPRNVYVRAEVSG